MTTLNQPTLQELINNMHTWLDYKEPNQFYTNAELINISTSETGQTMEEDFDLEEAELKAHEAWVKRVTS